MPFVREPAVAGYFYTADAAILEREVDTMIDSAEPPKIEGRLCGLISPHAGYLYSGPTAAHGYKLLRNTSYDAVIVIGPSHREYFDGITMFPGDSYRTPLGDVPVNNDLRSMLAESNKKIMVTTKGHRLEHSIEVQLPFLQRILGAFTFVPMIMGDQRRANCEVLAEAIANVCRNKNVLLIASSDLSHYHSYDVARQLDDRVIADIRAFDPDGLMTKLEHEEVEACGGGPIVAALKALALLGCEKTEILSHCNSGDVTSQYDAVVGYLSAAILQSN
ncbi:MAG: AmmeMemoRadiSam system protein B [Ignavibacteria bacterium]|nr:AmmeMemoRadiSam system protein B [Ignavibacteria bacterium]